MVSNKKRNRPSHHKFLFVFVVLGLILAGFVALKYLHKSDSNPTGTSIYDKPLTNNDKPNKTNPNGTPTQAEENSSAASSSSDGKITGVINFASATDDSLAIRTTINNSLTDGTCSLTLTRASDGKTVTKTANVVANPASATCAGFDIPTNQLGAGSWTISIEVDSGGQSGVITGSVSI